jgi:hypothetical protein
MSETEYSHITCDITIHFARKVTNLNPQMIFCFMSGTLAGSSEEGRKDDVGSCEGGVPGLICTSD